MLTVKEAYAQIDALVDRRTTVSIDIECAWSAAMGLKVRGELETTFTIYIANVHDVSESFDGPTLESAMQSFLASRATEPMTVEEVDAVLA